MASAVVREAAAAPAAGASVRTTLNYLRPTRGPLETWAYDPPDGRPRFNGVLEAREVAVADAREPMFGTRLGPRGFTCLAHPSALDDFWDEDALRAQHYPEAEALVRELTGARRAFVFDHTLRRRAPHRPPLDGSGGSFAKVREPVGRVHLDYTPVSGPARAREVMAAQGVADRGQPWMIVGLWRALHEEPLADAPLALADARSIASADLVTNHLVYPHRRGQTFAVLHSPRHAWHHYPGLTRDAVLAFVHFHSDTLRDGVPRGAPHSAFEHPATPPHARPRQSLELRVLALLDG